MPEYLHPGVYVQEVPSAVRPIEGVSTSTAGFVGIADKGPAPGFEMPIGEQPTPPLVTSFAEYTRVFGGYRADSFLTYAVQSFFANGGRRAYISRLAVTGQPEAGGEYGSPAAAVNARLAAVGLVDREDAARPTLAVIADSPGAWGNSLGIRIATATQDAEDDPLFKLIVLEDGEPVEAYDDLSMDPTAGNFVDNVVNTRSEYIRVLAAVPDDVAEAAEARPALTDEAELLELIGDGGASSIRVRSDVLLGGPLSITTTRDSGADPTFRLVVARGDTVLESFQGLSLDATAGNFVERKVNGVSSQIRVTAPQNPADLAAARPTDGTHTFPTAPLPAAVDYDAGPGADGITPPQGDAQYLGRSDLGTGLYAFDKLAVNILAIPGGASDVVISGGMAYCRNRQLQDCFFVAEAGSIEPQAARVPGAVPSNHDKNEVRDFVIGISTPNDYGALYWPWVRVTDPIGRGRGPTIAMPPSGAIAGLYARIDNSRGVFKAPAGTEAAIAGALGVCADVQDADQDILNPIGLNVIRRFPGYGVLSWGTRTLGRDPAWRYVPVRRTAIFLRTSIFNGIQWAVFEPNDAPLWGELRLNVTSFMLTQFRARAFQGASPADAFFVRCDATTTTQQDIDNGVVNILVGFAPLKPAEFVVLKLSQKVLQPAA
jgi:Bacteriophage tail sheath protein